MAYGPLKIPYRKTPFFKIEQVDTTTAKKICVYLNEVNIFCASRSAVCYL